VAITHHQTKNLVLRQGDFDQNLGKPWTNRSTEYAAELAKNKRKEGTVKVTPRLT